MAYLTPRGHPVPLRPRRRVHRLRRLPLLVHRLHRPQPLLHVDAATPATTARAAARCSATTRPATTGRRTRSGCSRPGSPGRSTRTSATAWTRPAPGAGSSDAYIGNYGDNSLLYFNQYRNAAARRPAVRQGPHRHRRQRRASGYFDAAARPTSQAGKLPQVSWIVAPEAFTEHPNWPANYGAWYISQVLDALTSNPEVWSKTALFITYDENDGFFDHVVPPYPPASAAQGASTVRRRRTSSTAATPATPPAPTGSGQRVPMLVVSPWSTGGWVCSETFDHTSIIRFMEQRFGVHEPNISPVAARRLRRPDLGVRLLHVRRAPPRPCPAPRRTSRRTPIAMPDYVPTPPTAAAGAEAGSGSPAVAAAGVPPPDEGAGEARRPHRHHRQRRPAGGPAPGPVERRGRCAVQLHGGRGSHAASALCGSRGATTSASTDLTASSGGSPATTTAPLLEVHARPRRRPPGAAPLTTTEPRPCARTSRTPTPPTRPSTCRPTRAAGCALGLAATHGWYDALVTVRGTPAASSAALAGRIENGRPSTSDPQLGR